MAENIKTTLTFRVTKEVIPVKNPTNVKYVNADFFKLIIYEHIIKFLMERNTIILSVMLESFHTLIWSEGSYDKSQWSETLPLPLCLGTNFNSRVT